MCRLRRLIIVLCAGLLAVISSVVPAQSEVPVPLCGWQLVQSERSPNVLAPHEKVHYWFLHFTNVPRGRLVIRGEYPQARYFSFVAHDESLTALGGLNDTRIEPDPGSVNPFLTRRSGSHEYTAYVDFGTAGEEPEPNTLYAARPTTVSHRRVAT